VLSIFTLKLMIISRILSKISTFKQRNFRKVLLIHKFYATRYTVDSA